MIAGDLLRSIIGTDPSELLAVDPILPLPQVAAHDRARVLGGFLGVAIGDAVALPYEGDAPRSTADIETFMEIDYTERSEHGAERVERGAFSDDTQLTLDVAMCLAERGRIDPAHLMSLMSGHLIRGAGAVMLKALHYHRFGADWDRCGLGIAYNGAAMRAMPIGVFSGDSMSDVIANAVLSSWVTHVHPAAVAGAVVMAHAAAYAYRAKPEDLDSLQYRVDLIDALSQSARGVESRVPPVTRANGHRAPDARTLSDGLSRAREYLAAGGDPLNALGSIGCSVLAVESVCAAVYLFLTSPRDFRRIVATAICAGGDCDTVASMAGGLCGLLLGTDVLPSSWRGGLLEQDLVTHVARTFYAALPVREEGKTVAPREEASR